ncbi:hypothetical protein PM082_016206 [Marasmius tenuissimus]|nr:hypothetical protein PM082_016206 [Marasmius tenuissimus]
MMGQMMDKLTYPNTGGEYRKIAGDLPKASVLDPQDTSRRFVDISAENSVYEKSLVDNSMDQPSQIPEQSEFVAEEPFSALVLATGSGHLTDETGTPTSTTGGKYLLLANS